MQGPKLVGYPPTGLRWSGDSQRLYFEWRQPKDEETSTWVVAREGGQPRKLTDDERKLAPPATGGGGGGGGFGGGSGPQWDDAHRRVLAVQDGDIVLIDTVAQTRRALTRTTAPEGNPRWAKDETHVTFTRENSLYLLSLTAQGDGLVQLTDAGPRRPDPKPTASQQFLKDEEQALLEAVREDERQGKAHRGEAQARGAAAHRPHRAPVRDRPRPRARRRLRLRARRRTRAEREARGRARLRDGQRLHRRPPRPHQGGRHPGHPPPRHRQPEDQGADLGLARRAGRIVTDAADHRAEAGRRRRSRFGTRRPLGRQRRRRSERSGQADPGQAGQGGRGGRGQGAAQGGGQASDQSEDSAANAASKVPPGRVLRWSMPEISPDGSLAVVDRALRRQQRSLDRRDRSRHRQDARPRSPARRCLGARGRIVGMAAGWEEVLVSVGNRRMDAPVCRRRGVARRVAEAVDERQVGARLRRSLARQDEVLSDVDGSASGRASRLHDVHRRRRAHEADLDGRLVERRSVARRQDARRDLFGRDEAARGLPDGRTRPARR